MKKFVAVDCGKYSTKFCTPGEDGAGIRKKKFRTKMSPGVMEDDMLERYTYLVRIDGGDVYMVGMGASKEAELETAKDSEIHKVCTMAAIAMALGSDADEVDVAVGIPFKMCQDAKTRMAYKDYILPEGKHTVEIKASGSAAITSVTFTFGKRYVYPESIGVLYTYPAYLGDIAGIIDIGHLNINSTYCANYLPVKESSFTDEMGGQIIISGLAQDLTSELGSRVDDNLAAATLLKPEGQRFVGTGDVAKKSAEIISEHLLEHVKNIKRRLDARHWPVDFMHIVMIGGTSRILVPEIRQVFGEICRLDETGIPVDDDAARVFIPNNPEFVNVEGFLRKMCADSGVDLDAASAGKEKK